MPSRNSLPVEIRAKAAVAYRQRVRNLDELAQQMGGMDARSLHQQKYWNDPAGWALNCIKWLGDEELADYQAEILQAITDKKRVSARAPHGAGKSSLAALAILWFADTRDGKDWKVATTASAWRQLKQYLWPEVHKWVRRIRWDVVMRKPYQEGKDLLDMAIKGTTGEAFAVASDNSDLIEGAHADEIFFVYDESKAIPMETWDAVEGAFSTGNAYALSISTPGEPQGRFYEIQSRKAGYLDWWVRPVTLQECISAGRINKDWADARRRQWGEKSAVYQNRVEGNFAASDEDGIIPLVWVERAIERWHIREEAREWSKLTRVAADIGRGGDPTVLARLHDMAVKEFEVTNDRTVMPVTGRIKGILEANMNATAVIDVIGIGAGVVDRLREMKSVSGRIQAFNAAGKCDSKDKTGEFGFVNQRAWAWWTVRELLQDDLIDLPDNEDMIGELTAPKYEMKSGGRIQVEEKEELRKRLGRSTNYADTVIQAYWKKTGGPSLDSISAYGSGKPLVDEDIPDDIRAYAGVEE